MIEYFTNDLKDSDFQEFYEACRDCVFWELDDEFDDNVCFEDLRKDAQTAFNAYRKLPNRQFTGWNTLKDDYLEFFEEKIQSFRCYIAS